MEKKTDFKALSKKAKAQYIWDYYRWPIIIALVVIGVTASLIRHFVTYREPILNVIMINCNNVAEVDNSGFDEFLEAYGHDPEDTPVELSSSLYFTEGDNSTSYNDYQVLSVMIAAGDQDIFMGTGSTYLDYANQGVLKDLSTLLPQETLEKYKDHLIYTTIGGETEAYPCAIELTDNAWVQKNQYYNTCYFGVFTQSQNQDVAAEFTEFLLNYK